MSRRHRPRPLPTAPPPTPTDGNGVISPDDITNERLTWIFRAWKIANVIARIKGTPSVPPPRLHQLLSDRDMSLIWCVDPTITYCEYAAAGSRQDTIHRARLEHLTVPTFYRLFPMSADQYATFAADAYRSISKRIGTAKLWDREVRFGSLRMICPLFIHNGSRFSCYIANYSRQILLFLPGQYTPKGSNFYANVLEKDKQGMPYPWLHKRGAR